MSHTGTQNLWHWHRGIAQPLSVCQSSHVQFSFICTSFRKRAKRPTLVTERPELGMTDTDTQGYVCLSIPHFHAL